MTREPRIDTQERLELLALMRYDAEMCDCGYHPSMTDPNSGLGFEPHSWVCPVCAGKAKWDRVLHKQDEAIAHDAAPLVTRPSDGRRTGMRLMAPDETQAAADQRAAKLGATRDGPPAN